MGFENEQKIECGVLGGERMTYDDSSGNNKNHEDIYPKCDICGKISVIKIPLGFEFCNRHYKGWCEGESIDKMKREIKE